MVSLVRSTAHLTGGQMCGLLLAQAHSVIAIVVAVPAMLVAVVVSIAIVVAVAVAVAVAAAVAGQLPAPHAGDIACLVPANDHA